MLSDIFIAAVMFRMIWFLWKYADTQILKEGRDYDIVD